MIRIVFIASGLGIGGAEVVLLNLLRELDRGRFDPAVVSLTGPGPVSEQIAALGIPVHHLDFRRHPLGAFISLTRLLRRAKPAVVQTWMYHGDLIGSLAARLAGVQSIAWSLHNLLLDQNARTTRWIRNACARLSRRLPGVILSCSEATAAYHVAAGYDASRMQVIPNGFDTTHFRPDTVSRTAVRQALGVPADARVVLHLGRLDPLKNHAGFLRAAARVAARVPDAFFLMAGRAVVPETEALTSLIRELRLEGRVQLLGPRADVPRLLAASDLLTQTSTSEAFPMVLGEAMSCGVPCVASDVGDSALIVGDAGLIVPARDDAATADGIERLLRLPEAERVALGRAARQRIVDNFDIRLITRRYEAVYLDMTGENLCAA